MRLHDENKNQMNFFKITLVGNCLKNSGYANLVAYLSLRHEEDQKRHEEDRKRMDELLASNRESVRLLNQSLLVFDLFH